MGLIGKIFFYIYMTFLITLLLLLVTYVYVRLTMGRCRSYITMMGKSVLVTGANSGMGYATARNLAMRGARTIVTCRNQTLTNKTVRTLKAETLNDHVVGYSLDLASFDNVKECALQICNTEPKLDVLIHNAASPPARIKRMSRDGHELMMQVNYYAPFLFTHLLLPVLRRCQQARVICVIDKRYSQFPVDMTNFESERMFVPIRAYSLSKLCLVYMTRELAQKLTHEGITVNCCNPGLARTKFFNDFYERQGFRGTLMTNFVLPIYGKSAEGAAETTLLLAVSSNLRCTTGRYFSDCEQLNFTALGLDDAMAKRVWDFTVKTVDLGHVMSDHMKKLVVAPGGRRGQSKDKRQASSSQQSPPGKGSSPPQPAPPSTSSGAQAESPLSANSNDPNTQQQDYAEQQQQFAPSSDQDYGQNPPQ